MVNELFCVDANIGAARYFYKTESSTYEVNIKCKIGDCKQRYDDRNDNCKGQFSRHRTLLVSILLNILNCNITLQLLIKIIVNIDCNLIKDEYWVLSAQKPCEGF